MCIDCPSKRDVEIGKLFVGETADLENYHILFRGGIRIKVLEVSEEGVMMCQIKSTYCD